MKDPPTGGNLPAHKSTFDGALSKYAFQNSGAARGVTRSSSSTTPLQPAIPNPSLKRKASDPPAKSLPCNSSSSKRSKTSSGFSGTKAKPKRSSSGYAPPSKYAHIDNLLTDSLAPNLITVFIGVNPGIRTATTGHAYNHPSNLFWKLLHSSGCTSRRCRPEEDGDLPRLYSLGLTNIVSRPTKDASELSKEEMDEGVAELEEKTRRDRPEAVVMVGKSIWESVWRVRHKRKIQKEEFRYGWQDEGENFGVVNDRDEKWVGARVFVARLLLG